MKRLFIFITIVLTSCSSNKTDTSPPTNIPSPKTINKDSVNKVKGIIDFHWKKYKEEYGRLQLDSLKIGSSESYRVVIGHSWGYNPYGGQPTSITFHKTVDTCYAVVQDMYSDPIKSILHKTVKFIPENYFDSIRVMFNTGTFWQHPPTTTEDAYRLRYDPDYVFFEAVKDGKHKLVSQLHNIDSLPILKSWKYNFYHYSYYSRQFEKDWVIEKNRSHD